jgi:2-oxoglutarate dehydrogenase E2 component (dihydrolipoamide succinyltransferase)
MADIHVPNFPESVTDGTLVTWRKRAGEAVRRGDVVADIETDKVVFEVPAVENGVLAEIIVNEGAKVISGQVLGRIGAGQPSAAPPSAVAPAPSAAPEAPSAPSARKLMAERGVTPAQVAGSGKGGRILKEDVLRAVAPPVPPVPPPAESPPPGAAAEAASPRIDTAAGRTERRVPMTRLRARIAERLVSAQRSAAMLTTFNEINMQAVSQLRATHRERFEKQHGVRLGFMSFFVKACVEALKRYPEVNASIDGPDIVYHGFFDVGVAVSSPRGLVVPVLRDAERASMAEIEKRIREFGEKARDARLTLEDLTGGTFTITNGGVFGSLLSTPILNPPQSAILGMHKIEERPVAENGQVVIRPMMYVALSYDHRLVDGREAVGFLVTVKELLEDPTRLLLEI